MASRPRTLNDREKAEVASAIRPLVDRFSHRFGVPPSKVLSAAYEGTPRKAPSLPANYVPKNPVLAKLIAAAALVTHLSAASIIEDSFEAAQQTRDAVIYVARSVFDLSYETIGRALADLHHEAVMDGYCRALGHLEHANKEFHQLVQVLEKGGRR